MSRYAEVYKNTKGPGDARPTALQIVEDEGLTGKLTDKVFLVTGVSSGMGVETLRALYATGAHVFGTVRDMPKGQKVVDEIKAKTEGGKITLLEMRNDSLASVKKAAAEFLKQSGKLNLIINNAGVMTTPEGKTEDGFETQFGINHISHFLLFWLLKDTLLASSTPDYPSRVVAVASYGHRYGKIRLHDYNFTEPGSYDPGHSYGQAKTANIWFSNELERRYGSKGLHSTSLHPAGVWTGLQVNMDSTLKAGYQQNQDVVNYMMNTEQGAATQIYAALSEEWKNKGGKYLSKCQVADHVVDGSIGDDGYEDWAYDEQGEKQLWNDTLKMLGLEDEQ